MSENETLEVGSTPAEQAPVEETAPEAGTETEETVEEAAEEAAV